MTESSDVLAWCFWMGLLGLCMGSYLNAFAMRHPKRLKNQWDQEVAEYLERTPESLGLSAQPQGAWFKQRSACPVCHTQLTWWQLIPVLGYVLLRGRCHHCKTPISLRYPLVELVTAGLFAGIAHMTAPGWHALALTGLVSTLIALALIDLDSLLLPDDLTLPLMWAGLIYNALSGHVTLSDSLWGAIAGYLSLWLVYQIFFLLTGKEGMGFGDFKLLAALGAWLGWQVLLPVVLLASLSGAVIGVGLMVLKGHDRHQPIPFGPYLVIGGLMAIYCLKPGSTQWLNLITVL